MEKGRTKESMWILYAFGASFFAGITAVLVKIGVRDMDSNLATALRMIVISIFSWAVVFTAGSYKEIGDITLRTLMFLILSGMSMGISWICYFKALKLGDVNKVAPIDRSSTVIAMMMAFIFLGEKITVFMFIAMAGIIAGTFLMLNRDSFGSKSIEKEDRERQELIQEENETETVRRNQKGMNSVIQGIWDRYAWAVFASVSAFFTSLTAIFGKMGIDGVEANLGTAIRTIIVLAMAWMIVWKQKNLKEIKKIGVKGWIFTLLSGLCTGLSWMYYYRALQGGYASIVVPIDKLSIVVTVFFSWLILKEKVTKSSCIGLALISAGTLCLLL